MGKIDDMRRQREEQHAAREKQADKRRAAEPAVVAKETAPAPKSVPLVAKEPAKSAPAAAKSAPAKSKAPDDELGECTGCGKRKALSMGLIVSHQKGFGKACPGARKEPA